MPSKRRALAAAITALATLFLFAACASDSTPSESIAVESTTLESTTVDSTTSQSATLESAATDNPASTSVPSEQPVQEPTAAPAAATQAPAEAATAATSTFVAEVWADNWFALYINGVLVGEDSVPITTERSFNKETITFEASYPFTLAIEAKDFKQTDSGIEYIGARNQQMGDGGLIAQVTDTTTGSIVAVSNTTWSAYVTHQAPLNKECEKDADPDTTCLFEISETPAAWADQNFDDTAWNQATEWTEAQVSPKDGYDEVSWDSAAQLIWGSDLEIDNTILFRTTIS